MANVVIAIPNEGWIHYFLNRMLLYMHMEDHGHQLKIDDIGDRPIDNCRNKMIKRFLDEGWGDYLLFIDSDNPPMQNPLELVQLDKDIIGLPTPIWFSEMSLKEIGLRPIVWNSFDWSEDRQGWVEHVPEDKKLCEVDAVGSGCMIIAKRVLERVKPAFRRNWDSDGCVVAGSDMLFCKRAKERGFKVFTHYGYPCRHFKRRDLVDIFKTMQQRDLAQMIGQRPGPSSTPEAWDHIWKNGGQKQKPLMRRDLASVVSMVCEHVGKTDFSVIDYGCGDGKLLEMLNGVPGCTAKGVDFSGEAMRVCTEKDLECYQGDWLEEGHKSYAAGNGVDVVVCADTLQLVEDDKGLIRRLFSVAPLIIASVPNDCRGPAVDPMNLRVYTPNYLRELFPNTVEFRVVNDDIIVIAKRPEGKEP